MSILLLIIALLLFVGLVVFHEFGHFIAARRNGVEVEEFGIGFPPRAKTLAIKKGTRYTLNWLPLGGFVKLKGENDSDTEPGSYGAASLKTKIKIMVAGVALNLVAAFLLFTVAAYVGMPQLIPDQYTVASDTKVTRQELYIANTVKNSPAEKAGLKGYDRLVNLKSGDQVYPLEKAEALPPLTKQFAGQTVGLTIDRGGEQRQVSVTLRTAEEVAAKNNGYLGVEPVDLTFQRSTWSSPIVALGLMKQFTTETFKGLGRVVGNISTGKTSAAANEVSGPVGVFVLLKNGSLLGPAFIISVIAFISLTLAIMNVLPIPALDGGRLFFTLLFRAFKKPLTKDTEDKIHGYGFLFLMVIFVLITIADVKRFS